VTSSPLAARNIDDHHAPARFRIATGAHGKAGFIRKLDQALSLTQRLCAYGIDPDLPDDLAA
jgi:hypothetical protein